MKYLIILIAQIYTLNASAQTQTPYGATLFTQKGYKIYATCDLEIENKCQEVSIYTSYLDQQVFKESTIKLENYNRKKIVKETVREAMLATNHKYSKVNSYLSRKAFERLWKKRKPLKVPVLLGAITIDIAKSPILLTSRVAQYFAFDSILSIKTRKAIKLLLNKKYSGKTKKINRRLLPHLGNAFRHN